MKFVLKTLVVLSLVLTAAPSFAQCRLRRAHSPSSYCAPSYYAPSYCSPYYSPYYSTSGCASTVGYWSCGSYACRVEYAPPQCEYAPSCADGSCAPQQTAQCADGSCAISAQCVDGSCALQSVRQAVANLLSRANAVRARFGLPALAYDAALESGAQYQAQYCARIGGLQHGSGVAEILAMNNSGFDQALNQWLNSSGHRALLLGGFSRAGAAVYSDAQGRVWCAMRFR